MSITRIDIQSFGDYPGWDLSNFASNKFLFDDVNCSSMEGLLQALKFSDPLEQVRICSMLGSQAKKAGKNIRWAMSRKLFWKGVEIDRDSKEYQDLLDRAYQALFDQSVKFRKALLESGSARLIHSMGQKNSEFSILTESEFCSRLLSLRARIEVPRTLTARFSSEL